MVKVKIFTGLAVLLLLLSLVGCSKEVRSINDFSKLSSLK